MLLIGSFFGTFIINVLSESKGRKTALILSCVAGLIGLGSNFFNDLVTLIGGSFQVLWLIVAGQFMCGFSAYPMLLQTYLYLFECC